MYSRRAIARLARGTGDPKTIGCLRELEGVLQTEGAVGHLLFGGGAGGGGGGVAGEVGAVPVDRGCDRGRAAGSGYAAAGEAGLPC